MQKSWEELRERQAFQGPTMEEREKRKHLAEGEEGGPFIGLPTKYAIAATWSRIFQTKNPPSY
jgi:hypothetical protein